MITEQIKWQHFATAIVIVIISITIFAYYTSQKPITNISEPDTINKTFPKKKPE